MTAEIKTNTQEKFPELLGTYKGHIYTCDFALLVYRSKHNIYKGIKVIGAAGPYSLNGLKEDRFISDILTLSYTDPSKVKALFNFASKYNAIFLNINMPSKRIIKATKDLMDAFYYEGFGGFDTVASIEKLYRSNNITRPLMITDMGDGKQPNLSIYDIKKSAFEKIYVYDEADGLWYKAIKEEHEEYCFISGFEVLAKSEMTLEQCQDTLYEWACEEAFYNGWMALASIEDVIEYANENGDDYAKSIISYYKRYIEEREKYNQNIDMIAPEEITPELICKEFNSEFIKQKQPYKMKYGYRDKVIVFILYKNNERIHISILPIVFNYELKSNGINIPSVMLLAERYSRYRYGNYEGDGYWG